MLHVFETLVGWLSWSVTWLALFSIWEKSIIEEACTPLWDVDTSIGFGVFILIWTIFGVILHNGIMFGACCRIVSIIYIIFGISNKVWCNFLVDFQEVNSDLNPIYSLVIMCLIIFLINLAFCVIGYRSNYDQSRIENPSWTAVFG
jgi:hypothetical protein